MSERVRCAVCDMDFQGRVPKGGDGSALVPYPHKRWHISLISAYPEGSNSRLVSCEGRFEIGKRLGLTEDVR